MTKIREQADQITQLMAQLEEATKKAQAQQSHPIDAPSPSARSDSFSLVSSRITSPEVEQEAGVFQDGVYKNDAEVQDWIAKARASIEAFGGYISMGGPSATREMLADDDFESAEGQEHGESDEYEVTFEEQGDEPAGEGDDAASASTSRRVSTTPERKRLATIPATAVPFGLMAQMSLDNRPLRRIRSKGDMGEEQDEVEGIAGDDYLRPSKFMNLRYWASSHISDFLGTVDRPFVSENHQPPHILRNGLVTPAEVEKLFKMSV